MKVPYRWLQQYVKLPVDAAELARRLTLAGLENDDVEVFGEGISGVVVAKVVSAERHPDSDHISVCKVDDGSTVWDIICGAPNVATGEVVPLARVGATLPGGVTIAAKKAMGLESQGMICSKAELGLDIHDTSGIWVLPAHLEIGADLMAALELPEPVLNIDLTPNRSDCLGILNCAHEAATLCETECREPFLEYEEKGPDIQSLMQITVEDPALCPRYVARLVQGVKIGPSPLWMQNWLLAAGMRPINNVVDISNFVMLEMNQPLHTFDYDQLKGQKIHVRAAYQDETMQTLDGKDRTFLGTEIMICDAERTICIGGVMGGVDTEVTEATVNVLIEAACFNPVRIRQTARRLGIPSEASQRFEKGVDVASCDKAARRAAQLMVQYCGATACQGVIDVGGRVYPPAEVTLRLSRVNSLLGTEYTMEQVQRVIRALGFAIVAEGADSLNVQVPSYRQDITLEEDLIEEVARLQGYESIPLALPSSSSQGRRTQAQLQVEQLRELAVAHGLSETLTYSFISPKESDRLQLCAAHPWRKPLPVANPLTEEQSVMRMSLLPGLLQVAHRNISRRNLDLALFEQGTVFLPKDGDLTAQPDERPTLSILLTGSAPADWQGKGRGYDYFYLKGLIESIFGALGVHGLGYQRPDEAQGTPYLHPGRSAHLLLDGRLIGVLGQLHPAVAENYELPAETLVAELDLQPLFAAAHPERELELPKYPASRRDIALLGSAEIPAAEIADKLRQAGGPLLRSLELFDLYDGAPIPTGQRSLAFALQFRDDARTLTDAEIDAAVQQMLAALPQEWGLKLRD